MQKLFIKKEKKKKKEMRKNRQVPEIFKIMGTQMPVRKKRERKDE